MRRTGRADDGIARLLMEVLILMTARHYGQERDHMMTGHYRECWRARQTAILVIRMVGGCSVRQIASCFGIDPRSVKYAHGKAKERYQRSLEYARDEVERIVMTFHFEVPQYYDEQSRISSLRWFRDRLAKKVKLAALSRAKAAAGERQGP